MIIKSFIKFFFLLIHLRLEIRLILIKLEYVNLDIEYDRLTFAQNFSMISSKYMNYCILDKVDFDIFSENSLARIFGALKKQRNMM